MTELIIDGTSAVLPKDFSIQVKRENPLFTKNGEYTYDMKLRRMQQRSMWRKCIQKWIIACRWYMTGMQTK